MLAINLLTGSLTNYILFLTCVLKCTGFQSLEHSGSGRVKLAADRPLRVPDRHRRRRRREHRQTLRRILENPQPQRLPGRWRLRSSHFRFGTCLLLNYTTLSMRSLGLIVRAVTCGTSVGSIPADTNCFTLLE